MSENTWSGLSWPWTAKNVLVFRFPPDITVELAHYPVDVFGRDGVFLGTAELREIPIFVSGSAMYFSRADADGNVYLGQASICLEALGRHPAEAKDR